MLRYLSLTPLATLRIKDHTKDLLAACKKDIGKGTFETSTEVDWCTNDCIFVSNKLEEWAKDESIPDIPFTQSMLRPKCRKEPLGIVLIIGYGKVSRTRVIFI